MAWPVYLRISGEARRREYEIFDGGMNHGGGESGAARMSGACIRGWRVATTSTRHRVRLLLRVIMASIVLIM